MGLAAAALVPRLARLHGLLLVLTLLLLRFPSLALPELNPDESEDIANARTLAADPRFGLSAEGHTHGPLAILSKLLPRLVGLPVDYASVRLVGVLMVVAACLTLRRIFSCTRRHGRALWTRRCVRRCCATCCVLRSRRSAWSSVLTAWCASP